MVTLKDVEHIAKLARIRLTKAETKRYQIELSSILDYFEKLKKADTSKAVPMTHSVSLSNVFREDVAEPESPERIKRLMNSAPETEKGYFKVKSVF